MIAVLIPAHNEAASIGACLASVLAAASHPGLDETVRILVAVDRCTDHTVAICRAYGATVVDVPAPGGVGAARSAAAACAIKLGASWLAMTDADTRVPKDWLVEQRRHGADAVCGVVEVDDWEGYPEHVIATFRATQSTQDGHSRVHGANLGVSAELYLRCGGFLAVNCSEDVALVDALISVNARIARVAKPIVWTSARRVARAQGGFSDFLKGLERIPPSASMTVQPRSASVMCSEP